MTINILMPGIIAAAVVPVTLWNPADKSANITLSNGNKTATNSSSASNAMVRADISKSTGKLYVEGLMTVVPSSTMIGVAQSGANLENFLGSDAFAWGYLDDARKGHSGLSAYGSLSFFTGDVAAYAIDIDGGSIEFFVNNVSNGVAFSGQTFGTVFPAFTGVDGGAVNDAMVARFNAADQQFSPPSGFAPWGG